MPRRPRLADDALASGSPPHPGRGDALRDAFARRRREFDAVVPPGEPEGVVTALLDAVVPDFAPWCLVDVVTSAGVRRFARHAGCGQPDHAHQDCREELAQEVAGLDDLLSSGVPGALPRGRGDASPREIAVPFEIDEEHGGVIAVVTSDDAGFDDDDRLAISEVAERFGIALERRRLARSAREAVRHTQRLASQLHQLIAASLTVGSLRDESAILTSLATSAQGVFDADVAAVTLETGTLAPLHALARRGALPRAGRAPDDDVPRVAAGSTTPWTDRDWLVAPILHGRDLVRGVVAFRRAAAVPFGTEEREVLILLAQLASTALAATELTRTIERSEERLRVLVETAPVGIIEVDEAGRAEWWNGPAARILAWPEYHDDPTLAPPAFPDEAREGLGEIWDAVRRGEGPATTDLEDVTVGPRRRQLTAAAALLPGAGDGRGGVLTLIDDVTEGRQLRAELRHAHTMEIRGQVASRVAHDFNNLLTLISGYAEILSREIGDDVHAAAMVRDIQATASRASLLTGQLQTIGRTKAPQAVVFNPAGVITSDAEVIERVLGTRIELLWSLDHDAGTVRADADQFEQMILNLAINARDAMPEGGHLSISVGRRSLGEEEATTRGVGAGEYVAITVSDDGTGMDDETRRRCFEPLFTTKGAFKGTGMGLASAQRLVSESGGSIECRSRLGEGTTFDIVLPRVGDAEGHDADAEVAAPHSSASILLADDDPGLRRLMAQVLRRNGYRVEEVDSGEAALECAATMDPPPDLLVSDVDMAEVSGRDVASSLQADHRDLRVLLVSGTAHADAIDELAAGSADFLAKPFKPSELIDRVNRLLARRAGASST